MNKKEMRSLYLNRRANIDKRKKKILNHVITNNIIEIVDRNNINNIMSYVSTNSEVHTHQIIHYLLQKGKIISAPYTIKKHKKILPIRINNFSELKKGTYNILEPQYKIENIMDYRKIELVIIPGLAFDLKGNRIGYGGGFYDSFLNKLSKNTIKLALAYDVQLLKNDIIDTEAHDISVDYILTENELINCMFYK